MSTFSCLQCCLSLLLKPRLLHRAWRAVTQWQGYATESYSFLDCTGEAVRCHNEGNCWGSGRLLLIERPQRPLSLHDASPACWQTFLHQLCPFACSAFPHISKALGRYYCARFQDVGRNKLWELAAVLDTSVGSHIELNTPAPLTGHWWFFLTATICDHCWGLTLNNQTPPLATWPLVAMAHPGASRKHLGTV